MASLRPPPAMIRLRPFTAILLLVSLLPGLVAPVVSARTGGVSAMYSGWLVDQIDGDPDARIAAAMERLDASRQVSLAAYLDAIVADLVDRHGLEAAGAMLGIDAAVSATDVVNRLMQGLHSLASGALPAATLLAGPDVRSVLGSSGSPAGVAGASTRPALRVADVPVQTRDAITPLACRPASGGAQPLGP